MKTLLYAALLLFASITAFCSGRLTATILNDKGESLLGAQFKIEGLEIGAVADDEGKLVINKIPSGEYFFYATHVGHEPIKRKITIHDDETLELKIVLAEKSAELNEVVVTALSAVQETRQAPYHVNVLDAKPLQAQSIPVVSLVNQISGVRVREEGGMGSQVNIMLNGIGGKGVRIFIDNVPADLMGSGMALNNLPVNMIERVEVYKGVIPVKFGSDALGGVINIIPHANHKDFIDASLTYGSWNTLQSTISSGKHFGKNKSMFMHIVGFYNHSDNNYWMRQVDVKADDLGNTKKANVRRFNDAYTSWLGEVELGVENKLWADVLKLNLSLSVTDKEWQHGVTADKPWGETFSEQQNINTAVTWKKSGLAKTKLDLSVIAGFNFKNTLFIDTASRVYYWNNEFIINQQLTGESGLFTHGRTPDTDNINIFGRTNFLYTLNDQHVLNLTTFYTQERLSGKDEKGTLTYGADPLSNAQTLTKNYAGLSWEAKLSEERITNIASIKHFYSKSNTSFIAVDNSFRGQEEVMSSKWGYGDAVKLTITPTISTTAGYEYTLRQPDAVEIFGDYIQIYPNARLEPERSHNINVGLRYHLQKKTKLSAELNAFYRNTSDQIFLNTLTFNQSAYMNLLTTEAKGIEAEVRYSPIQILSMYVNGTYQDIRLKDINDDGKIQERYIDARLPNMPYLFGNAGLMATIPKVFVQEGSVQLFYQFNFVNEFFRSWEVDGNKDLKAVIPTQAIHGAGLAYLFPKDIFSISFECRNLTNEQAFDNYSVQKPGRSFYIKLRVYLSKQ